MEQTVGFDSLAPQIIIKNYGNVAELVNAERGLYAFYVFCLAFCKCCSRMDFLALKRSVAEATCRFKSYRIPKIYNFLQGKPKNSYNIKGIRRGTSDFKTMELT